jgi:hypothetical protein
MYRFEYYYDSGVVRHRNIYEAKYLFIGKIQSNNNDGFNESIEMLMYKNDDVKEIMSFNNISRKFYEQKIKPYEHIDTISSFNDYIKLHGFEGSQNEQYYEREINHIMKAIENKIKHLENEDKINDISLKATLWWIDNTLNYVINKTGHKDVSDEKLALFGYYLSDYIKVHLYGYGQLTIGDIYHSPGIDREVNMIAKRADIGSDLLPTEPVMLIYDNKISIQYKPYGHYIEEYSFKLPRGHKLLKK